MAIKTHKPTTATRRMRTDLDRSHLTDKKPEKQLTTHVRYQAGRKRGRISVRHKGGRAKRRYRLVDFVRDKHGVSATVAAIEYDPNRGADLALLHYHDGEKRYILAPDGLEVGATVEAGEKAGLQVGNALPLSRVPLGMPIHNIELRPGKGGQMVRGAGTGAVVTAKEDDGKYVQVRLPSKEIRRVLARCYATLGEIGNADLKNIKLGKAGRKRRLGIRPATRGVAYSSPRDHPHGGSYKTSGVGLKHPKTPWGKVARGVRTRRKKRWTNKFIVSRRKK